MTASEHRGRLLAFVIVRDRRATRLATWEVASYDFPEIVSRGATRETATKATAWRIATQVEASGAIPSTRILNVHLGPGEYLEGILLPRTVSQ